MKIQFGRTYRDVYTGFEGVAIGYVTYVTGCNQLLLAPKATEPDKMPSREWVDEERLAITRADAVSLPRQTRAKAVSGGDILPHK